VALNGASASADIERCRREIANVEAELLAGNPDVAGLVLALADWTQELGILQGSTNQNAPTALSPIAGSGDTACTGA